MEALTAFGVLIIQIDFSNTIIKPQKGEYDTSKELKNKADDAEKNSIRIVDEKRPRNGNDKELRHWKEEPERFIKGPRCTSCLREYRFEKSCTSAHNDHRG